MLKFKNARGWKLLQFGKYRIELWWFPSGFFIEKHAHPLENIEVLYLFGSVKFYRTDPNGNFEVSWRSNFIPKLLSLPAGYYHWFYVSNFPLVAINFSKFFSKYKPVSASEDILFKEKENYG